MDIHKLGDSEMLHFFRDVIQHTILAVQKFTAPLYLRVLGQVRVFFSL